MADAKSIGYKPPFVWFGGKSAVASVVWKALGDVKTTSNRSLARAACVLFLRPDGPGAIETVNDADGFVANFGARYNAIQTR